VKQKKELGYVEAGGFFNIRRIFNLLFFRKTKRILMKKHTSYLDNYILSMNEKNQHFLLKKKTVLFVEETKSKVR